jgi:hypothetical protein
VKHIPEWVPGAGFKRKARIWGRCGLDSRRIPFEEASKLYVSFNIATSVTGHELPSRRAEIRTIPS